MPCRALPYRAVPLLLLLVLLLQVYLDDLSVPVVVTPMNLNSAISLPDNQAYVVRATRRRQRSTCAAASRCLRGGVPPSLCRCWCGPVSCVNAGLHGVDGYAVGQARHPRLVLLRAAGVPPPHGRPRVPPLPAGPLIECHRVASGAATALLWRRCCGPRRSLCDYSRASHPLLVHSHTQRCYCKVEVNEVTNTRSKHSRT